MLLEFTVGNYLSFKDKKTLSLEASSITEYPDNVIEAGNFKVLRSAVLYGANSSGKSNLIKAFEAMQRIVEESGKGSSRDKIKVEPFLLSTETEKAPTYFEVLILIDGVRYRYGFEVDEYKVHSEWLFRCINTKETEVFVRLKDSYIISKKFQEGMGLQTKTRSNALFLSVVDQFNGKISKGIMKWFGETRVLSGLEHVHDRSLTLDFLSDPQFSETIKGFLSQFNLGFDKLEFEGERENFVNGSVNTYHKKFDSKNEHVGNISFSLNDQESSGTNKLFDMAGYIWVALILGDVVIVDELDAKLHPILTQTIVKLFNDPDSNPANAQLIFVTHDTNLLSQADFRRDQIYFAEKDHYGATDLYSLVEYKGVDDKKIRKDRSFEKDYIDGRYGAIPFVGDFTNLIANEKAN